MHHTATRSMTQQHTTHCNIPQHIIPAVITRQSVRPHNTHHTLQHAAHCNTLQHAVTCGNIESPESSKHLQDLTLRPYGTHFSEAKLHDSAQFSATLKPQWYAYGNEITCCSVLQCVAVCLVPTFQRQSCTTRRSLAPR